LQQQQIRNEFRWCTQFRKCRLIKVKSIILSSEFPKLEKQEYEQHNNMQWEKSKTAADDEISQSDFVEVSAKITVS
jgi:hypothetical protein